jgi:hypothetical protein
MFIEFGVGLRPDSYRVANLPRLFASQIRKSLFQFQILSDYDSDDLFDYYESLQSS